MKMKREVYVAPEVELELLQVECGFSGSVVVDEDPQIDPVKGGTDYGEW